MCETCEVLREALAFERERTKELVETITALLKPQVEIKYEPNKQLMRNVPSPAGMTFTRRRAELEKADRIKAEAEKGAAKPDASIEKLEKELNIPPKDSMLNTGS